MMRAYFDRFNIDMTKAQALRCSVRGVCDFEVESLLHHQRINKQMRALNPVLVADELRAFGAWSEQELADHGKNLQRLLWIAAGKIREYLK